MALFNIKLDSSIKYKSLVKNIYFITVVLLMFHLLIKLSCKGKVDYGLTGKLFNNKLMNTLCLLLLSYMAYELVFKQLISIQ